MKKISSILNRDNRHYSILGFIFLSLLIAGAFVHPPVIKSKKERDDSGMVAAPYRTIPTAVDSQNLYAYELHKRKIAQDELPEYCAIIRQVDPAKDDYKAYCKLVISDIIKTAGTDKLIVYIYDSNEAYELYETKFLQHYVNLDTTECNTVNEHFIASYTGDREGWDYSANHQLSYYENAHNGKTGHETYMPE